MGASRYEREVARLVKAHGHFLRSNPHGDIYRIGPDLPFAPTISVYRAHKPTDVRAWRNMLADVRRAIRKVYGTADPTPTTAALLQQDRSPLVAGPDSTTMHEGDDMPTEPKFPQRHLRAPGEDLAPAVLRDVAKITPPSPSNTTPTDGESTMSSDEKTTTQPSPSTPVLPELHKLAQLPEVLFKVLEDVNAIKDDFVQCSGSARALRADLQKLAEEVRAIKDAVGAAPAGNAAPQGSMRFFKGQPAALQQAHSEALNKAAQACLAFLKEHGPKFAHEVDDLGQIARPFLLATAPTTTKSEAGRAAVSRLKKSGTPMHFVRQARSEGVLIPPYTAGWRLDEHKLTNLIEPKPLDEARRTKTCVWCPSKKLESRGCCNKHLTWVQHMCSNHGLKIAEAVAKGWLTDEVAFARPPKADAPEPKAPPAPKAPPKAKAEDAPKPLVRFCPGCGAKHPPEATKFCAQCGSVRS